MTLKQMPLTRLDHRDLSTCRRMAGLSRMQMYRRWERAGSLLLVHSYVVSQAAINKARASV